MPAPRGVTRSLASPLLLVLLLAAAAGTAAAQSTPPADPARATRAEVTRIAEDVRAMAAFHDDPRAIEKRWGAGPKAQGLDFAADTCEGRVLLACMGPSLRTLSVAIADRGGVHVATPRTAEAPPAAAARLDQFMSLARLHLVHPTLGADTTGEWAAIFWMGESGSASPHSLWWLPLRSEARMDALAETEVAAAGSGRTLAMESRTGDAWMRTFGHRWGLSSVLLDETDGGPHLTLESTWRFSAELGGRPQLVRAALADDGLGALARAYERERGRRLWPADDVTLSPRAKEWFRAHVSALLHAWQGDEAAVQHVVLRGTGSAADTAAFVVKRTGRAGAWRWSVDRPR